MNIFLKIIIYLILFGNSAFSDNILDADFTKSMSDGNTIAQEMVLLSNEVKIFKKHYELKKPSKMLYHKKPLIPKVMHHIWDGPIPPLYQNYLNECKKLHPDWEFKFWGDKDIDDLKLEYKDIYNEARTYASRSDIARYEILYRFGGVYRDMDVKCFRPIDDLNHKYEFFVPIEPPTAVFKSNSLFIPLNNGIIGACSHHPILKTTLSIIQEKFYNFLQEFDQTDQSFINGPNSAHALAVISSMIPLTEGFLKEVALKDKSIALPPTYFFSLLNRNYLDLRSFKGKIVKKIQSPLIKPAFHLLRPESLMLHNAKPNKREIPYCEFRYGNHMGSMKIKNLLYDLKPDQRRILKVFREVYIEKAAHNILNKNSKTPQIIHFIIFDYHELSQLERKISLWKMLNGDFEINIWDKNKILATFQDLEFDNKSENYRFYLALRILEKFGGTYASYKAIPHQSLFELNNKYNFYSGLMPITNSNQKVALSQKLLGASKMHYIISKTLQQINKLGINNIDQIFLSEVYKRIYLFGSNIVFPAVYFEPLLKLDDENILDKIKNFITNSPKAFSNYTEFTVVE